MSKNQNILFSGELRDGFSKSTVAQNLARVTKLSDEKIEKLLKVHRPIRLHKNLSYQTALKYKEKYANVGLVVRITKCPEAKPDNHLQGLKETKVAAQNNKKEVNNKEIPVVSTSTIAKKTTNKTGRNFLVLVIFILLAGYSAFTLFPGRKAVRENAGRVEFGVFTANYYKVQNKSDTEPELLLSEEVSTPAIDLDPFSAKSFLNVSSLQKLYVEWEGPIEVFENQQMVYSAFQVSWAAISFFVDGQLIDSWENKSKRIAFSLSPGRHDIKIEYHNNNPVAQFNASFGDKQQVASYGQAVQIFGGSNLLETKSAFIGIGRIGSNYHNQVVVNIQDIQSPVILFLSSLNGVNWTIHNPWQSKITAICLLSRGPGSSVATGDPSVPVLELNDLRIQPLQEHIPSVIVKLIGKSPDYVYQIQHVTDLQPISIVFK